MRPRLLACSLTGYYRFRFRLYRFLRAFRFCPRACLFGFTVELFKNDKDEVVQKQLFLYLPLLEIRIIVWSHPDFCVF